MEHSHVMGGSTAARRIHCTASLQAEAKIPDDTTSDYAMQGTVFHSAMEMMLTALDPDAPDYDKEYRQVLRDLKGNDLGYGEQWAITAEQIDTKIIPAWKAFIEVISIYPVDDWFIEQQVSLDDHIPGAFGTSDLLLRDRKNRLHVLDWKFGDGVPVPVEGNLGLTFYGAAALYDPDPELIEFCEGVEEVVFHIVQPRVGSNEVLYTWEIDVAYLDNFVDRAEIAMVEARGENPPFKAGDHCLWCKAKIKCDEYARMGDEALSTQPEGMTVIELAAAIKKADLLTGWIKAVYKKAFEEAEKGVSIPGSKLVNKKPSRAWKDQVKAEKALRSARFKISKMFKKNFISPTQLEKENKKLYDRIEEDQVHLYSSGLTLVRDSDKRPAVVSSMDLLANALEKTEPEKEKEKEK